MLQQLQVFVIVLYSILYDISNKAWLCSVSLISSKFEAQLHACHESTETASVATVV